MMSLRCCLGLLLVAACSAEATPSANTCADGACDHSYDGKYVSSELDHMAAADTSVQLLQRQASEDTTTDDVEQADDAENKDENDEIDEIDEASAAVDQADGADDSDEDDIADLLSDDDNLDNDEGSSEDDELNDDEGSSDGDIANSVDTTRAVDWAHEGIAGDCATTKFVSQEILDSVLGDADKVDFCTCFGDTHCAHVPFDKVHDLTSGQHHYQYFHSCASTFAKSAPENPGGPGSRWEVQISQVGKTPEIWGTGVKVGGITFENWANHPHHKFDPAFLVNGERVSRGGEPVHLPNGLHYWHTGWNNGKGGLCLLQEGQFLMRHVGLHRLSLVIPKKVKTQTAGTVCYDKSNIGGDWWLPGVKFGILMKSALVEDQPGLMTQQKAQWDYIARRDAGHWNRYFKAYADQCNNMLKPDDERAPEPEDPETACKEHGYSLAKAQESCGAFKENYPVFYADCLIDECVFGDDGEVEMISEVIGGENEVDKEEFKCDLCSETGNKFNPDGWAGKCQRTWDRAQRGAQACEKRKGMSYVTKKCCPDPAVECPLCPDGSNFKPDGLNGKCAKLAKKATKNTRVCEKIKGRKRVNRRCCEGGEEKEKCKESCVSRFDKYAKKGKEDKGRQRLCKRDRCAGCDFCTE